MTILIPHGMVNINFTSLNWDKYVAGILVLCVAVWHKSYTVEKTDVLRTETSLF